MSAADNKRLLQNVFAELAAGNGRPFVEIMAEDVAWTITGTTGWSRTYRGKRAVIDRLLTPLNKRFAEPYRASAQRIIAEDDHVVVESRGAATTREGRPYNNAYCYIFRLAGGKVREITEYMDTALVNDVLGDAEA